MAVVGRGLEEGRAWWGCQVSTRLSVRRSFYFTVLFFRSCRCCCCCFTFDSLLLAHFCASGSPVIN